MRLKLNYDKLECLYVLFKHLIDTNPPSNKAEKLVMNHVKKVLAKMGTKYQKGLCRDRSVLINDDEELAFDIFCNSVHIPEVQFLYEKHLINNLLIEIDKKHG